MTPAEPTVDAARGPLLVVAALRSEYAALAGRVAGARLERCGMGPARVAAWLAARPDAPPPGAVAVAGVAGGLDPSLRPGDVVVASEVRGTAGRVALRAAAPLVAELRRLGLRVRYGPVLTTDTLVGGPDERERLAATGALAVDMESAPLARAFAERAPGVPVAVVRVVVDTATVPVFRAATVGNGVRALRTLRRLGPALDAWARLAGPRSVVLAEPRSFCAGVERAIDIVDLALQRYQHPVYVRRQIVHNAHVVRDLERRGAVFVDELGEVPDGTTVVFSAHGVAPAVRDEAARRDLFVIDATCPLVAKVHAEARRFAARGDTVLLIGHDGHDETEGTLGEVPGRITLVQSPAEAEQVAVADPGKVSFLMQTTLAVDEAADTVDVLRRRFPAVESSATDDICYATTNRQQAVREVAVDADVVIVVGSRNSSNSLRLVEVAQRAGTAAHLVDDATELAPEWLTGARRVGVTAGASAPPHLVDEVVGTLQALGPAEVTERVHTREDITFTLPKGVVG
ncbi:4-hydroxy-3-methylbut-2-enyl diphosphate reductase [Jatrophihabitans endophyticus]|uniref:4-hydroxy-3-methylbut-2-enyl diphosphate reductase n=1 Tax=Jatrophihabitans endophyticus TaxID=1206085 RepID=A0A1M5M9G2_9ACTN|nr:4-hydroxy-3-methylbut-2-enyl diphosphate reductase [Jatrophihabitans endophyticus]SHG73927.1 4-hydroxy-3-methylbut-2-enyl diphosphate reductase [Jatrophihabitans endophyticus]